MDGMLRNMSTGEATPGAILRLWAELRQTTGVLEAKKKEGVRFKVRSAEDLIDKIRARANELGILIYPGLGSRGEGSVIAVGDDDDKKGTMAGVNLVVIAQAVEDGSQLAFYGYGLGADQQDKAGGKAGTYAFKQALVQALLAGGKENAKSLGIVDTDDSDTPIPGGVRPPKKAKAPTVEDAERALKAVKTQEDYAAAIKIVMALQPANQLKLRDAVVTAKAVAADNERTPDRSVESPR